ncbi:MAG: serine/threonine-protein kinase [Polyangiaceae bacterium]
MLAQGHLVANRYRLVRTLAQGGMGSLWVAHDTQLGRQVAVKVMVPAASALPELVARFEREAKAAAQLRSAHAVQVYEHGVDRGQPFIVMELLDGEDLAAVLRRERRLSLEQTARLLDSVCKAVRAAHELGIVHRDLKPANIFLAHQDDEIVVKVLDFGVAKLTGPEADVTRAHALLGTPHFMAPEQARDMGIPVDHRADLWALGVIAFRALTGKLPFVGEDPIHVLVSVASQAAPLPSSVAPDLGPEIDDFFAIALARGPSGPIPVGPGHARCPPAPRLNGRLRRCVAKRMGSPPEGRSAGIVAAHQGSRARARWHGHSLHRGACAPGGAGPPRLVASRTLDGRTRAPRAVP